MLTDPENVDPSRFRKLKISGGDCTGDRFHDYNYDITFDSLDPPDHVSYMVLFGIRPTVNTDKGTRYAY